MIGQLHEITNSLSTDKIAFKVHYLEWGAGIEVVAFEIRDGIGVQVGNLRFSMSELFKDFNKVAEETAHFAELQLSPLMKALR